MTKINGFEVKNKGKTGEVWLYGTIGDDWEGVSARTFADSIKSLGSVDELKIFINSPGGSVSDGIAMHTQLARHQARKVVSIDAYALSAASVVAMSGDEISIADGGFLMIHDPWTITLGNAADLRATADLLDRHRDSIAQIYSKRTGIDIGDINNMMAAETWLSAAEAVDKGFADSSTEAVKAAACAIPSRMRFQNMPSIPNGPNHEIRQRIEALGREFR